MISLLALQPALACGGFFCNNVEPVLQKAERIVFVVDEVAETVETHVQVEYEGPAEEFAWIVPVQAQPELFLTTEMLFTTVGQQLQPVFATNWMEEGRCDWDVGGFWGQGDRAFADTASVAEDDGGGGGGIPAVPDVTVVDRATVGPYDTVTLQATNIDSLMEWLAANEYAIPSTAADAIAPYVSPDGFFVALKLVKGNESGDLAPLGLRYNGTKPAVPIQLTSVAAAEDLRLEVTVFGSRRAVPESYLHVTVNDAAIDWFQWGGNYQEVITRAADEAGGHAFATDYAGTTDVLFANFALEADLPRLAATTTPTAWIDELQSQGFRGSSDMLTFFESWFPVASGMTAVDVYNCPSCNPGWYAGDTFDPEAVTTAFDTRIVAPRLAIDTLISSHPYVTRMTSSLSAAEMTIDPTFVFTDHREDVPQWRTADLIHDCHGKKITKSKRRLRLPDGREIDLPSMDWFEANDTTESDYLAILGENSISKIERTGTGAPELITDLSAQLEDQVDSFNNQSRGGCGCSNTQLSTLPSVFLALGALLGLRRR